ncbi:MAG: hypothetical protein WC322_00320 [Candidatus Paceibacterota bacterium]
MTTTTINDAAQREKLIDLIAARLSGTYHCDRVWSAWSVGTMSEDDFSDVGESDTPAELADSIMELLGQRATAEQSKPDRIHVLAITTAYEMGVGKGRYAQSAGKEIENPCTDVCGIAWELGYNEGKVMETAEQSSVDQVAAPAAVAVPDGWRLVPVRPTPEWIGAVADDGYADCNVAQLIASILSHAPAAVAVPVDVDAVAQALFDVDDFIARVNGNDRGAFEPVNVLRRALLELRRFPATPAKTAPQPPVAAQEHSVWVNPCDKSQDRYLPNIGEPVLFKHEGRVYTGRHTGGSFKADFPLGKHFGTWDCLWAYPAALDTLPQPAPVAQGDALIELIERVGNVRIQRVRKGFNGPIRWEVEYGYEDTAVHGRTLRDAINAAARAQAKEGGAA